LGLSIFWRRTWCKVCPLGTIISLFNKVSWVKLKVNRDKCDGCDRCSSVCQMSLDPQRNGLRSIDCIKCLDCDQECETFAIKVKLRIP
jgi:polyferredoxin